MTATPDQTTNTSGPTILYSEQQWVPWYWWFLAFTVVALLTGQFALNRSDLWLYGPAIVLSVVALWVLFTMSNSKVIVEQDPDGTRWLVAGQANLPNTVVSRSLAVPESAKRNAMGRQLDPAAYVRSRGWIKQMVMLVLDDPNDPTPYWLISTKNPEAVLQAFVPDQADEAIKTLHK